MGAATIQTFDQVAAASSLAAACSGEGEAQSSLQSLSSPRTFPQLAQHRVHMGGNGHRLFGDRFVSHAGNQAQR